MSQKMSINSAAAYEDGKGRGGVVRASEVDPLAKKSPPYGRLSYHEEKKRTAGGKRHDDACGMKTTRQRGTYVAPPLIFLAIISIFFFFPEMTP